ncbi:choice-of-anchor Q domain-containing protein [Gynurincola endophyticus]|uniref:choice-of-anchor Q domain-containing protein n=1 Tax=Gynurincola endophyticus TaxID=2479004 RepID=UPI000F8C728C|nr:choice-of-anchor Q domain-containing protein [Gynurincola endophyticus]
MKITSYLIIIVFVALACNKTDLTSGLSGGVKFSVDSLKFDTLLAGLPSSVHTVKVFNTSNEDVVFDKVELGGGTLSNFSINLHGRSGSSFSNIQLPAKDSIYLFVTVTPANTSADHLFLIRDSITFSHKNLTQKLQLEAYAEPVTVYKNVTIQNDLTLEAGKSYFIQGIFTVAENVKLNISEGVKIYVYPNSPIEIKGILNVNGNAEKPVLFTTYRKDYLTSGSWEGIRLSANNQLHTIKYTRIEYAKNAIILESTQPGNTQLTIEGSAIRFSLSAALRLKNINLSLNNSEITNNNINISMEGGGEYNLKQVTAATYSTMHTLHQVAGISINDTGASETNPMKVDILNSIIWGDLSDELRFLKGSNHSIVNIRYSIYKMTLQKDDINISESQTTDPLFAEIDISKKIFNFKLSSGSPAIDKGLFVSSDKDITGALRTDGKPDLGCYEFFYTEQ